MVGKYHRDDYQHWTDENDEGQAKGLHQILFLVMAECGRHTGLKGAQCSAVLTALGL